MELRTIKSPAQFPYEEIKQAWMEEKYVKKYKTVKHKIMASAQK